MKIPKRKPSGREKDAESLELLEKLRQQVYTENISDARRAAYQLSWMQEDGLEILLEVLFGDIACKRARTAAAYGLRKMRGRMKNIAIATLKKGTENKKKEIREVTQNSMRILEQPKGTRTPNRPKRKRHRRPKAKIPIREISHESPRPRYRDNHARRKR